LTEAFIIFVGCAGIWTVYLTNEHIKKQNKHIKLLEDKLAQTTHAYERLKALHIPLPELLKRANERHDKEESEG